MDAKDTTGWPKDAPPLAEAPFDAAQRQAHQAANLTAKQLLNSAIHEWSPIEEVKELSDRIVMGPHLAANELSPWFHAPNDSGRFVLWEAWRHTTEAKTRDKRTSSAFAVTGSPDTKKPPLTSPVNGGFRVERKGVRLSTSAVRT